MSGHLAHILAAAPSNGFQTAWEFLQRGGVFMIPLALTSVAGVMAILYKILSLSRSRVVPSKLAREVEQFQQRLVADKTDAVLKEFNEGNSVLARMSAVAIKHSGKSRSEITHAVESAAREETVHLHAGIGVLDTVITIAPLLGLLGTASGLVRIFQGLGDNSDHLAIARGIAEALTTTIVGLAIAVPCVIAHGYFTRRIEMLTARLESLLSHLTSICEKPGSNA
ncbi:MAG: MotA/TolQ/ExbB proton channel family protein [Luteolibacter sp.]|uniref:MotA/TolQ/ExbB proton channel family protein n=1 Tax=Luteolibacter sp. TaxID=1962973 RepID=UPI003267D6F6